MKWNRIQISKVSWALSALLISCLLLYTSFLKANDLADEAVEEAADTSKFLKNLANDVRLIPVYGHAKPMTERGPFTIVPDYGNATPEQQVVIQYAVDEWDNIIQTTGHTCSPYPIEFSFTTLYNPQAIGETAVRFDPPTTDLVCASIYFAKEVDWFVDPTPWDDSDVSVSHGTDLLSVARHEIGHAVGWVGIEHGGFTCFHVKNFMDGYIFDPSRLNIATTGKYGEHADCSAHGEDLMCLGISEGVRRSISFYPDVSLVARAFNYEVTLRFVDGNVNETGEGTANNPWKTVKTAFEQTPGGISILLIPDIYHEVVPLVRSTATTLLKARGVDVVITGP